MISLICFGCGHSRRGTGKQWHRRQNSEERIMKAQLRAMPSATLCTMVFPSTSQGRSNGGLFLSVSYVHMYRSCKIKMRCFCDSKMKMDQGFFQVSSFPLTIQSPRHMLQKWGPCLARHTSTSAGGSPAADSPPTRRRPAPASGPEAMPPRRSPRLVEDLHCNRPASQGNSSPAKSSARVKA